MIDKKRSISLFLLVMLSISLFNFNIAKADTIVNDIGECENIIINQVYGGGSANDNNTAVTHTFIELYNPTDEDINLEGYSIQYGTTGSKWSKLDLNGVIPAKHSFLVRGNRHSEDDKASGVIISEYDMQWDILFANKGVKVALISNTNLLDVINPFDIDGNGTKSEGYVDMVGAGEKAGQTDGFEGDVVLGQSKQKSVRRVDFKDTDNNAEDFEIVDFRPDKNSDYENYIPKSTKDGAWGIDIPEEGDDETSTEDADYLIINQFYGGGKVNDNGTSVTHGFIELYNPTNETIDLSGYSLQYNSGGEQWEVLELQGEIPSMHSFLVRGNRHSEDFSLTVMLAIDKYDQEWDIAFNSKGAKIVLLNTVEPLAVVNPFNIDGNGTKAEGYVDFFGVAGNDVGVNDVIDGCESEYVAEQSKQKAFRRVNFIDTDNNKNDFEVVDYRKFEQVYNKAPRSLSDGPWDESHQLPEPELEQSAEFDFIKPNTITNIFGDNPETTRVITWQSAENLTDGIVEISEGNTLKNVAVIKAETELVKNEEQEVNVHRADINELKPDTTYTYRVGSGNDDGWSDAYTFTTAREDIEEFTFIQVTDTQATRRTAYEYWGEAMNTIIKEYSEVDFIMHTGDLIDTVDKEAEWRDFFDVAQDTLASYSFIPVVGNHEEANGNEAVSFKQHFTIPNNGANVEGKEGDVTQGTTYSFDYGNVHFAVLNSESDLESQGKWLIEDMANSDKKWKIAAIHAGPYAVTAQSRSFELASAIEEAGIDLVLTGDDHYYMRTYPMKDGEISEDGVIYLQANATGAKQKTSPKDYEWIEVAMGPGKAGFNVLTVSEDSISVEARIVDGDEITTIDTFKLSKESEEDDIVPPTEEENTDTELTPDGDKEDVEVKPEEPSTEVSPDEDNESNKDDNLPNTGGRNSNIYLIFGMALLTIGIIESKKKDKVNSL